MFGARQCLAAIDRLGQGARSFYRPARPRHRSRAPAQTHQGSEVSVEVDAYRSFFILGEVRRPGQYLYVNVVEGAVAIAEGYTERPRSAWCGSRANSGAYEHSDGADRLPGATSRHYLRSRTLLLKLRLLSAEIPKLGSSELHASHSALLARALRGFVSPRTRFGARPSSAWG